MPRRRTRHPAQVEDFGPPESLRNGRVVVIGERPRRQGRAITVLSRMSRADQTTAMGLLLLWERCRFTGFALSNMEKLRSGGFHGVPPGEAAIGARRALDAVQRRIAAEHWSVLWFVLLSGECQALYAIRAGIDRHHVKARLQAALQAVAALSNSR